MPELPEIVAYLEALQKRIGGRRLEAIRIRSFSLLKTVDPPIEAAEGRSVVSLERMGKRIVVGLEDDLFLVLHLMVAGRLQWHDEHKAIPGKVGLAAFDFDVGTLLLTEAGSKRRAALHLMQGRDALASLDPGGLEIVESTYETFRRGLLAERHTLKRALCDARYLSGVGGAMADEILHAARLSPLQININLSDEEIGRLHVAAQETLQRWVEIRRADTGDGFPEKVTAFHAEMAVHGKFREPCPVCGAAVQRIVYASRETNYCPRCQTRGKILADRSLSRLLKDDWPSLEEPENG